MITKQAYLEKVEAQLRIWNAEIEKLKANASNVQAEAKVKYQQQLEAFIVNEQAAQHLAQQLKQAGNETWQKIKADTDSTMQSLKQEFDLVRKAAQRAGVEPVGWAEGLADEDVPESIGWAEGVADEDVVESIGWGEGMAKEDVVKSKGWAEGYEQKKK
jgi:hypothetical protein